MVRVPQEGNAWIGSVVPRLHRAGFRIAIPEAWGASSFGTPMALLGPPPLARACGSAPSRRCA